MASKKKPEKEAKSLGESIYEMIRDGVEYNPEIHCPKIINLFSQGKGIANFCVEVGISRVAFATWQRKHVKFREAVAIGKEVGIVKWLGIAEGNPELVALYWKQFGFRNFGSTEGVRLEVDPKASPIKQYEQIMEQATRGEFTSAEIKQIMESINIGLRALEVCSIQKDVDELKEGLKKMEERELEYQIATHSTPQKDKASLDS